ncbi:MAG: hypothetical protein ACREL7_14220 [Longimicrobiales bacterium]
MERVGRTNWITKPEFHARLRRWLRDTEEPVVGDPDAHRRTTWIWIRDGHRLARLYADTTREAVAEYLSLVQAGPGEMQWTVVPSASGHLTKFAFGPDRHLLDGFHLYIDPRTLSRNG